MPSNFDSEVFEAQIDIEIPPEEFADLEEEIETPENIDQSPIKLKTKEVIQALETLRKFAELNGASDTAHRSLQEFETLCLKQREEASKQSNIEDFFEK